MIFAEFKHLTHRYDQRTTAGIKDLSFNIGKSEVTTLIGPSGSGKTTTLKIINEEIKNFTGSVHFAEPVRVAYVNQFPILDEEATVLEILKNELSHLDHNDQKENQARTVIARLSLTNEINSQIKNISGGQRQRVVIAKALVKNPTLLLLDEPFANLDKTLRIEILNELFSLFKEEEITIIWVTHNTTEALSYSDKLILLNFGELKAQGSPRSLYLNPPNLFCASFFGETNLLATKALAETESKISISFEGSHIEIPSNQTKIKDHKDILLVIHPEFISIDQDGLFNAEVSHIIFKGSHNLVILKTKNKSFFCLAPTINKIDRGQKVKFNINFDHIHYLTEI